MNNVTRNRIIAGVATAAMVATGGFVIYQSNTPNQCESILVDSTELLEMAKDYVDQSDNALQLAGMMVPINSDINRNAIDMKKNNCKGKVGDEYFNDFDKAYDDYRDSVLTRYPFLTGWF